MATKPEVFCKFLFILTQLGLAVYFTNQAFQSWEASPIVTTGDCRSISDLDKDCYFLLYFFHSET